MSDMPEYKVAGYGEGEHADFWIGQNENPAHGHTAFRATSKEAIDTFHKAGLEAGGTDNGAPGYRKDYGPGYYAAFIHDADGNNIEAVWHDPEPPQA